MLKMASTLDERAGEIASIINEFWSAIEEKMPEVFERSHSYALFKSGGVGPMHLALRDPLVKMHHGRRKFVSKEFLMMLEGADLLPSSGGRTMRTGAHLLG